MLVPRKDHVSQVVKLREPDLTDYFKARLISLGHGLLDKWFSLLLLSETGSFGGL